MHRFTLFISTMLVADIVGLWLAGLLFAGDARQAVFFATIVLAPVIAYLVTYRGGLGRLGLGGLVDE